MSIFFRRSINFKGVRLNLTGRGLGLSAGIRGARVGIGTRGPYVAGGRGGLYFRNYMLAGNGAARPTASGCAAAALFLIGAAICMAWVAFVVWVVTR